MFMVLFGFVGESLAEERLGLFGKHEAERYELRFGSFSAVAHCVGGGKALGTETV
jgi:hypothetical protein